MFRNKYHSEGTLNTYKVRLVAKGTRQKECFFDTYAPRDGNGKGTIVTVPIPAI